MYIAVQNIVYLKHERGYHYDIWLPVCSPDLPAIYVKKEDIADRQQKVVL